MSKNDINIRITLSSAEAEVKISELKGRFNDLNKAIKDNNNGLSEIYFGFQNFKSAVGGLLGQFGGFINAAKQSTMAIVGLKSIAEFKGITGVDKAVNELESVKKGFLSNAEAAQGLKNLLSAGLSLDQATDMMNVFANRATFGRNSSIGFGEAVINLSQAFKTEQSELGDASGMTENFSNILKVGAENIGKKVEKLSDAERALAKYNGIMQLSQGYMNDLNKASESAIGVQARFSKQWNDVKISVGTLLQNALTPLLRLFSEIIGAFNRAPQALKIVIVSLAIMTSTFIALRMSGINMLIPIMKSFIDTMVIGSIKAVGFSVALKTLMASIGPAGWIAIGLGAVIGLLAAFTSETDEAADAVDKLRQKSQEYIDSFKESYTRQNLSVEQLIEEEKRLKYAHWENVNILDEFRKEKQAAAAEDKAYWEREIQSLKEANREIVAQEAAVQKLIAEKQKDTGIKKATGELTAEEKKKWEEQRKSEDELAEYRFKTNRLSLEDYIYYLGRRLAENRKMYPQESMEALRLSDEIKRIRSAELQAEREMIAASIKDEHARRLTQIEVDFQNEKEQKRRESADIIKAEIERNTKIIDVNRDFNEKQKAAYQALKTKNLEILNEELGSRSAEVNLYYDDLADRYREDDVMSKTIEKQRGDALIKLKEIYADREKGIQDDLKEWKIANTTDEIERKRLEIDDWYAEEIAKAQGNGDIIAEIERQKAQRLIDLEKEKNQRLLDEVDKRFNQELEDGRLFFDTMNTAYDEFFNSILDKEMTGKQRREEIWEAMKNRFVNTVSEMLKKEIEAWAKNQIRIALIQKAKTTLHVTSERIMTTATATNTAARDSITLSSIAKEIAAVMKSIGVYLAQIAVKLYSYFASFGVIGMIAGVAAVAAVIVGIRAALRNFMRFAKGGRVEEPTLGLVGEEGPEIIAPEKDFKKVVREMNIPGSTIPVIFSSIYTVLQEIKNLLKSGLEKINPVVIPPAVNMAIAGAGTMPVSRLITTETGDSVIGSQIIERLMAVERAVTNLSLRADLDATRLAIVVDTGNKLLSKIKY